MHRAPASPLALAIAVGGGLAFVGSLLFFAVAYVSLFEAGTPGAAVWTPAAADVALFSAFALHHSVFARAGVKARIGSVVPPALERSIYVWIASLLFIAVCAWWRPVPGQLWHVEGPVRGAMYAAQAIAGLFTLAAARRLDVLDLAGVRQVLQTGTATHGLDDTGPYGLVRHPIYAAWIAFVWLAPSMTGTRLVFAVVSTAYLVVAIPFEERDLRRSFGEAYAAYSTRVRWRVVPFVY